MCRPVRKWAIPWRGGSTVGILCANMISNFAMSWIEDRSSSQFGKNNKRFLEEEAPQWVFCVLTWSQILLSPEYRTGQAVRSVRKWAIPWRGGSTVGILCAIMISTLCCELNAGSPVVRYDWKDCQGPVAFKDPWGRRLNSEYFVC
jgi:hypothetical protein